MMRPELPPRPPSAAATLASTLAAIALLSSGCAPMGLAPVQRPGVDSSILDPRLGLDVTRATTNFERDAALRQAERESREEDGGGPPGAAVTPALFWTGVIVGAAGAGVTAGGAVTGRVAGAQIRDGDNEGWSRAERQEVIDRGDAANTATVVGTVLAVVGLVTATVIAGVDYGRCGRVISKKRRRECEAR